jgi:hypothetical protein
VTVLLAWTACAAAVLATVRVRLLERRLDRMEDDWREIGMHQTDIARQHNRRLKRLERVQVVVMGDGWQPHHQ